MQATLSPQNHHGSSVSLDVGVQEQFEKARARYRLERYVFSFKANCNCAESRHQGGLLD